ncbi:MAG TPA: heparinase II/III family protein [Rhodocyclaceae bacterium]|nr:heparinase II/III family protein [Rhodocyclaceae bacterium]
MLRKLKPWLPLVVVSSVLGALVALDVVHVGLPVPADGASARQSVQSSAPDLPMHPAAEALPAVELPQFRHAHPRLPAPSAADIARMRTANPTYLTQQKRHAKRGEGNLQAAILMALIEPGSQDLERIFSRLMALEFHYRGNNTEYVALAYDWLHHAWSAAQREQLRARLIDGFAFTYDVIRKQRLSPYNVFLYNSPFQRLLAMAIVLYGPDEAGERAMRVAHHLLNNDVLPAWRQVMGTSGGWHEGGEYVGIGIGQAVYRVPAMWRAATGEDLFRSETYLRGFLDFLVYRTRPDGTHFRWGDAAVFVRQVPDQNALALEYGHAAAYRRMRAHTPTSWPWGPLADPALEDATARERLPLSRLFDGIGLVVARSDWGDDATYVTFKAGDNFWSHSHLDQGAFTIFKGGALAIDSGLYGPGYGSDHHMNYTYQTIAHNTVTVFDPQDRVSVVDRHGKERAFANDGGQRRVGSGWAVATAPINRAEWETFRELYHTGRIEAYFDGDGLTVAVADVTAAYTNALSGTGAFSHRTRRVERAWRIFAYDRVDDVVVVQDQLVATRPEFRKRWLLHTIEAPVLGERDFTVHVGPSRERRRMGGRLHGIVLFPRDAVLDLVGGPGFEFVVDGVNYDEDGKVAAALARRPDAEPGAWRIELSPGAPRSEDHFLVVMLPSRLGEAPRHDVRRLDAAGRFGAEITGPHRTTRWWFAPGLNGVEVEIETADGVKSIEVGERAAHADGRSPK